MHAPQEGAKQGLNYSDNELETDIKRLSTGNGTFLSLQNIPLDLNPTHTRSSQPMLWQSPQIPTIRSNGTGLLVAAQINEIRYYTQNDP